MRNLIGFLVILVVCFSSLLVQAIDFERCKECHQTALGKSRNRLYLHPPFSENQCEDCHSAADSAAPEEIDLSASPVDERKIERLADSGKADIRHGFLLPGEKVGGTLVIDLQGSDGKVSRRQISVPPLADLVEVKDTGSPPVISDVRVLKVERKLFVSATVSWRTDTFTSALVRDGNKELSQKSESCARLGLQHQVVLYNLKADHTYRFSVVSTDLFGRSQTSEPLKFSTSNPQSTLLSRDISPKDAAKEVSMVSRFRRLGKDYFLELTLDQPEWVLISSKGEDKQQDQAKDKNRGLPDDEFHAELSSMIVSSMGACLGCHKAHAHPVNALPPSGMTIIPEYPTLP
ncbi:MAG: hypothetical protein P8130_15340, partial [Deltaproteobacteria bacterium]